MSDLFGGVFVEQGCELVSDAVGAKPNISVCLDEVLVFDAVARMQKQTGYARIHHHTTDRLVLLRVIKSQVT